MKKMSVVVVTFNRLKILKKLLKRFENQTDTNFEVIVVSDGSTDGTIEWLKEYEKKTPFPLQCFDTGLTDQYGLAVARNIGIREAEGEIVLILDDDTFPTKYLVEEHRKSAQKGVMTGGWLHHTDPYETEMREERMQEFLSVYGDCQPKEFMALQKTRYQIENNTSMYKEDWVNVGLFNESITGYGQIGEIFDRLKAKGYKFQFNPRARIIHKDEYKRTYGRFKKAPHTIPVWLKKVVYPVKKFLKRYMFGLYSWLKRVVGKSI